ncbi:galactokinase [Flavobacteriales bacterium 34_180_T64]|nr:galactokinase [Flavobacteriales bacterium 34_180_T64]
MNTLLIGRLNTHFLEKFGDRPLLVFSPGRINIIGEHTDYNNGFVFPAAIDKGIVAASQKSEVKVSKVIALDLNEAFEFSLQNIHPIKNGNWKNYVLGVIAEIQKTGRQLGNFNLIFGGDIPKGAGLSSSAALENSIVFSLNILFDLDLTKNEMIHISQLAEHNYVGVKCGIMDQYASMYGQKNKGMLLDCKTLVATQIPINFTNHELLLINTNVKHSLAESAYNNRREVCENVAALLNIDSLRDATEINLNSIRDQISEEDFQKPLYVIQENNRVQNAFQALKKGDIATLGNLIYESHHGLENQYMVSCDELNFLVNQAKKHPQVIGSRMMGGGFGGCTLNIIEKTFVHTFKEKMLEEFNKNFHTTCSFYTVELSEGTHVIQQ